jgi:hypothetical protein
MSIRVGLSPRSRPLRAPELVRPNADAYVDLEGTIWMQESGKYFDRNTGQVALYVDYEPAQYGSYVDRV